MGNVILCKIGLCSSKDFETNYQYQFSVNTTFDDFRLGNKFSHHAVTIGSTNFHPNQRYVRIPNPQNIDPASCITQNHASSGVGFSV